MVICYRTSSGTSYKLKFISSEAQIRRKHENNAEHQMFYCAYAILDVQK